MGTRLGWASCAVVLCLACVDPVRAQSCGDGAMADSEACDDGNAVGGDGCAANCTLERDITCSLAQGSTSVATAAFFSVPTTLAGQIVLTLGAARDDLPAEPVPFVVRVAGSHLAPGAVGGVGTSCTTLGEIPGWGPGNAGGGFIDCGSQRIPGIDVAVTEDANEPNAMLDGKRSGTGPLGSVAFELGMATYVLQPGAPSCVASPDSGPPQFGPDAIPCTSDDPSRPVAQPFFGTTGTVTVRVLNPNGDPDAIQATATGRPIDCTQLAAAQVLSGATLVLGSPVLDAAQLGDTAVTVTMVCEPTAAVATPTPRIIRTCLPTATATSTPSPPDTVTPPVTTTATATPTVPPTATAMATSSATATPPPTATLPPTATPTVADTAAPPTATATRVASGCAGDCNGDATVAIDELVRAVNIALGSSALAQCPAIDANGDGAAGIEELVRAVNSALQGCPR